MPVSASFQHRNGALVEIHRHLRELDLVGEHQTETWVQNQKYRIQAKLVALLNGRGKPPEDDDLGINIHLGRLAITYKQAKHIWDERMDAHKLDPAGHPHPAKVLAEIAEAAVLGTPKMDPTIPDDAATPDRIWLGYGKHILAVTPFWLIGDEKKGTKDRLWIVTGYQADPGREAKFKAAAKVPIPKDKFTD